MRSFYLLLHGHALSLMMHMPPQRKTALSKSFGKLKRLLLAPLVYLVAVLLLIEDWLWDVTARALDWLSTLAAVRALENGIVRLPPYAALATFVLPALLLVPVKIMALFALAHGHAPLGIAILLTAKVAGAALSARLYQLTKPALMSLAWFARWLTAFIHFKNRLIARLRATHAWHRLQQIRSRIRRTWRKLRLALHKRFGKGKLLRLIRKVRAQQRGKT